MIIRKNGKIFGDAHYFLIEIRAIHIFSLSEGFLKASKFCGTCGFFPRFQRINISILEQIQAYSGDAYGVLLYQTNFLLWWISNITFLILISCCAIILFFTLFD